jgi:hypothetical protein
MIPQNAADQLCPILKIVFSKNKTKNWNISASTSHEKENNFKTNLQHRTQYPNG